MFICGSGSFNHHDEYEHEAYGSPCSTPNKRSKKSSSFCKIIGKDNNNNKNRFADRGLDKFYALLAELDTKKQKIYTQAGAEDISFVRFVYTNDSDQVKPIVVKVNKEKKKRPDHRASTGKPIKKSTSDISHAGPEPKNVALEIVPNEKKLQPRKKKRFLRCKGSFKIDRLREPYLYLLVIIMMVLLFLAIYGRSFAILCTSIGWYLVPSVVGGSSSSDLSSERKPKRKKEYVRRQSEKKFDVQSEGPSSPKSVINGLM
ncbi:ZCF37 [Striga hermonthica]|uniref:ZCF37 n=1 Tax=Striga hermonthica TaxID=68872 RepID=A0A9N7R273_STRHE|nr:ZCF37 [Striga hermonthica]